MRSSDIFHSPSLLPAVFRGKEQQVKLGTGAHLLTLALLPAPAALCFVSLPLFCQRDANAASLASLKAVRTHWHHLCGSSHRGDGRCKSISGSANAAEGAWLDWFCAFSPGDASAQLVHGPDALTSLLPGVSCKKPTSLIWARSLLGKSQVQFLSVRGLWQGWAGGLSSMPEHPDLFNKYLIHLT